MQSLVQVVQQLLSHPPYDLNVLKKMTQGLSLVKVRQQILEEIKEKRITAKQQDRLSCLFRTLGIQGIDEELCALVDNVQVSDDVRASAMAALFHSDIGQKKFEALDAVLRIRLSTPWIRPMMDLCAYELFPRLALSELFFSTPLYARPILIQHYEKSRQQVNAPVSAAYAELLNRDMDDLSLDTLFEVLENTQELKELSALMNNCSAKTQRKYYQWLNIEFKTDEQEIQLNTDELEINALIELEIDKLKKQ
jgi:hypothetical protein